MSLLDSAVSRTALSFSFMPENTYIVTFGRGVKTFDSNISAKSKQFLKILQMSIRSPDRQVLKKTIGGKNLVTLSL